MTPSYLLWGFAIAALVAGACSQFHWLSRITLVMLALLLLSFWVVVFPDVVFLSGGVWYDRSPYREIILFLTMALGMAARTISRAIEERREQMIKYSDGDTAPALRIDVWDFVYPFLVSFITFGAIMGQLGGQLLSFSSLAFAFQNGFFWQTLLKAR